MPPGILLLVALFASIAVGTTATFLAWRERPEPGALPLAGLLAGQSWWSTCLVFQVQAATLDAKLLWLHLSWVGIAAIPVAWLLFALEYTGHDEYTSPRVVALVSVVPAVTAVLALTGNYHTLLYTDVSVVQQGELTRLARTPGVWYWVAGGYTYILGLLGVIPLLGLVTSDATTFRGQSAALLVGLVVPWATNALYLAGVLPTGGLDPTPIAFAISGVTYLGALTRFRLLGTSPAPNKRARRVVFDRMQAGAIVVDNHDYVVDMNDSAAALLGVNPREALGTPAAALLADYDRIPERGSLQGYLTIDGQAYDVTVTSIENARGSGIGRVVTFHDVSQYLRQQERLKVLNRALRHNVRTETNLIHGYVDRLDGDPEDRQTVKDHVFRIAEISDKAREAIDVFDEARDGRDAASLDALLASAVATVRDDHPDVAVEYETPDDDAPVAVILDTAFTNVVENAAEHNTSDHPCVRVTAECDGDWVHVRVADNGPGIDDYERAVLEEGDETPLRHGSGLGLWIAKWGIDIAGGDVAFTEGDDGGAVVTIDVPVMERP
ncbi:histidine kinase N-terminal 7TM domain-containing protein [Halocalculus aciditolerans]|uniref:histidine kinase n=1 Tax=Halocalculus aciditolerans TaxID=1383812 RepID=A0A830FDC7_9EURY|nr:histidine kinase N-terminal 7TM domain-containing protein [Halocalculus aciditolerans]GGL64099.1 PAS domain-containing sensor histidine kinase [Halocalculus aciditolerans]